MIKIKELSKLFGNKEVLKNLSMEFSTGNVYGIVGENGAGKTTLFRCIAGLESYSGEIISDVKPLKNHLGLLLTEPFFFTMMTGREYIRLLCNARGKTNVDIDNKNIFKGDGILKGKPKIRRTMWSRRAQEYDQKINSGEIYQIAEVVRDLNKNTEIPVDQSYSERQLFEKAYDRLLGEVAIGMQLSNEDAKKKLDKALGKKETVTAEPI